MEPGTKCIGSCSTFRTTSDGGISSLALQYGKGKLSQNAMPRVLVIEKLDLKFATVLQLYSPTTYFV